MSSKCCIFIIAEWNKKDDEFWWFCLAIRCWWSKFRLWIPKIRWTLISMSRGVSFKEIHRNSNSQEWQFIRMIIHESLKKTQKTYKWGGLHSAAPFNRRPYQIAESFTEIHFRRRRRTGWTGMCLLSASRRLSGPQAVHLPVNSPDSAESAL